MGHLSLRELCEGNLEGGLLYWGPWRMCKGRLWQQASLSIGTLMGNLEGAHVPVTLKDEWRRALEVGHLRGRFMRGTWRDSSLTRNLEGYAKALEMIVCFHRVPAFGEH